MNSVKPLASLLICFYNQERYVQDTIEGALSQTYDNLEIVFSDDCSTDRTFNLIQQYVSGYKGRHRVIVNRNEKNLGLVRHVNKVMFELSHGEYIFANGGDDVSLPDRVEIGVKAFQKDRFVIALTCASIYINALGEEIGRMDLFNDTYTSITEKTYLKQHSMMCGNGMLAYRRQILDIFGPLNVDCQTEDSTTRFRALLLGKVLSLAKPGVKYRIHGGNMSIGNVVYKLKTHLIAEQYRKDLGVVKEMIDPSLYNILKKKIANYEINRDTEAVCALSSSKYKKLVYRIKRRIENFIFEWEISSFSKTIISK